MYIEEALYTYLNAQSGLTALVGDRIYFVTAPQQVEAPYLIINLVSSIRTHSHAGFSNLTRARFQFTPFAETYLETKQITAQLKTALDGLTGNIGDSPYVYIGSCLLENETDLFDSNSGLNYIAVDFIIQHNG